MIRTDTHMHTAFSTDSSAPVENMPVSYTHLSLLCMIGLLPQFLFYIPAYLVLLWHCYTLPQSQWNRQKIIFVSLMMSVGILLELYVNPVIIKAFLSTL